MTVTAALPRPTAADLLGFSPSGEMGGYFVVENALHTTQAGFVTWPQTALPQTIPLTETWTPRIGYLVTDVSVSGAMSPGDLPQGTSPAIVRVGFQLPIPVPSRYIVPCWDLGTTGPDLGVINSVTLNTVAVGQVRTRLNADEVVWWVRAVKGIAGVSYSINLHVNFVCVRGTIVSR